MHRWNNSTSKRLSEILLKLIYVAGICSQDERVQNGRAMEVYECITEEEKQNWNASENSCVKSMFSVIITSTWQ